MTSTSNYLGYVSHKCKKYSKTLLLTNTLPPVLLINWREIALCETHCYFWLKWFLLWPAFYRSCNLPLSSVPALKPPPHSLDQIWSVCCPHVCRMCPCGNGPGARGSSLSAAALTKAAQEGPNAPHPYHRPTSHTQPPAQTDHCSAAFVKTLGYVIQSQLQSCTAHWKKNTAKTRQ